MQKKMHLICINLNVLKMKYAAICKKYDGNAKLPPFVYQFYPYPNYPHIPGVQVDLFWNGSESEVYNV